MPFFQLLAAMAATMALAGCNYTDPYRRPGMWHPTGANDANLQLQAVRSRDLTQGRGTEGSDGNTAAAAVERLRNDKVKPLPEVSLSKVGSSGGSSGGGQ